MSIGIVMQNHWLYCVSVPRCWKTIGFIACSLKIVENPLLLLCFRSHMLKNHWFYCVFAQKCWKTIGFIVFSLQNVEKPLVLLCCGSQNVDFCQCFSLFSLRLRSENLIKCIKSLTFWSTNAKVLCFSKEKFSAYIKQY